MGVGVSAHGHSSPEGSFGGAWKVEAARLLREAAL